MKACYNKNCDGYNVNIEKGYDLYSIFKDRKVYSQIIQCLKHQRIYKLEFNFFGQYYCVNICSECYELKLAIEKSDINYAISLLHPKDGYDLIEKMNEQYYKELEERELILKDMYGKNHKLLNAPISMRFGNINKNLPTEFNSYIQRERLRSR